MRLSTRYGLFGIGALFLLSLVQFVRDQPAWRSPAGDYFLGVLPNFAAAIAIAFVLLSIWADQHRDATFAQAKWPFVISASISGIGLLSWEFFQKSSERFVFDLHDIGATIFGLGTASLLFRAFTPDQSTN